MMASLPESDTSRRGTTDGPLQGKVALVTGGTGSIGSAVCLALANEGCDVIVVDLDEVKCQTFAEKLPTKAVGVSIDVSVESAVNAGVDKATAILGCSGVDILINVAGILSNNKRVNFVFSNRWCFLFCSFFTIS